MHLSASDFIWEPDQGLEGGAWVAWQSGACDAVVQPLRENGMACVDEMDAPTDYTGVHAWWFDELEDAFLDPATMLPIDTYADFEVSEAPAFATFEQAVSAFQEPPAR